MRQYLLDTNILNAYMQGRSGVLSLAQEWVYNDEATTSMIVYGEIIEYLKSFPNYVKREKELRNLLRKVHPYDITYAVLERYADMRRAMRPPYGSGLIGDMDTLIAATAVQYKLTLVTTDSDFKRVPNLSLMLLPVQILKG